MISKISLARNIIEEIIKRNKYEELGHGRLTLLISSFAYYAPHQGSITALLRNEEPSRQYFSANGDKILLI